MDPSDTRSKDQMVMFGYQDKLHQHIMKLCKVDEQYVREGIKILMDWYKTQPHLPKYIMDWDFIEGLFAYSKFSIEKTKQTIDCYLTVRSLMPEFFSLRDPMHEAIIRAQRYTQIAFMPGRMKDGCMVAHIKYMPIETDDEAKGYDAALGYTAMFMSSDIRFFLDQASSEITLYDAANFDFKYMSKISPVMMKRAAFILQNAYSHRLKGFHVVNLGKFASKYMQIGKKLAKKKLADRVHIHENLESLHKALPKEFLVTELGGTAGDFDVLADNYLQIIRSDRWRDWFIRSGRELVDESKRPVKTNMYDEFTGVTGSFRKLNID